MKRNLICGTFDGIDGFLDLFLRHDCRSWFRHSVCMANVDEDGSILKENLEFCAHGDLARLLGGPCLDHEPSDGQELCHEGVDGLAILGRLGSLEVALRKGQGSLWVLLKLCHECLLVGGILILA